MSSLESMDRAGEVAIQYKIKLQKAREKRIGEECHRLESELRNLIFRRYLNLGEKYELNEV